MLELVRFTALGPRGQYKRDRGGEQKNARDNGHYLAI